MNFGLKVTLFVSTVILAIGLSMWAYGVWGPWYSTLLLKAPVSFEATGAQVFPFHVEQGDRYDIELRLSHPEHRDMILSMVGNFELQRTGVLDMEWEVLRHGQIISHGSNRDRPDIPYVPRTKPLELAIGSFMAPSSGDYELRLTSLNQEPLWHSLDPRIVIGIQDGQLSETLTSFTLLGAGLSVASAILCIICTVTLVYDWRVTVLSSQ
jgi:hypothetical protein